LIEPLLRFAYAICRLHVLGHHAADGSMAARVSAPASCAISNALAASRLALLHGDLGLRHAEDVRGSFRCVHPGPGAASAGGRTSLSEVQYGEYCLSRNKTMNNHLLGKANKF